MESLDRDAPPFRAIAIAGLGLIGGSIALGVRERWPSCRVVGVDRPAVQAHALSSGATLFDSYHCSRYNTNTGVLTTEMFEDVVGRAAAMISH